MAGLLFVMATNAASSSGASRGGTLDETSTLQDYLAYAARNNSGLEAAFERWQAALDRVDAVKGLPDPRLSYGYFIEEVETRVGPQRQKLGLTQTFPWFGKLDLEGETAFQKAEAERLRFEASKLKLFFDVVNAYGELYYLQRAVSVTEENASLLNRLEDVIRSRYRTGNAPHAALIKIQIERTKLEDHLRSLEGLREPLAARLNSLLGRPIGAEFPRLAELRVDSLQVSEEELLERLAAANPELLAAGAEAEGHRLAGQLAGKSRWPDITLGIEYMETGEARMPDVAGSGADPLAATLSINLPLWQGKTRAAERASAARRRAALHARDDLAARLSSRLKMVHYRYRDAERKVSLYAENLIPRVEQSLAVTEAAFRTGGADFDALVDAESTLLEFRLAHERAVVDRAQSLAEMELLTGADLWRNEP